jgi:hypothetical protein
VVNGRGDWRSRLSDRESRLEIIKRSEQLDKFLFALLPLSDLPGQRSANIVGVGARDSEAPGLAPKWSRGAVRSNAPFTCTQLKGSSIALVATRYLETSRTAASVGQDQPKEEDVVVDDFDHAKTERNEIPYWTDLQIDTPPN